MKYYLIIGVCVLAFLAGWLYQSHYSRNPEISATSTVVPLYSTPTPAPEEQGKG